MSDEKFDGDEVYRLLGAYMVTFQSLDSLLSEVLAKLVARDWFRCLEIFAEMSFKDKTRHAKAAFASFLAEREAAGEEHPYGDRWDERFPTLMNKCEKVNAERNKFIHSNYLHIEGGDELLAIVRSKFKTGKPMRTLDQGRPVEELNKAFESIEAAYWELGQAKVQLNFWLPLPSRQHRRVATADRAAAELDYEGAGDRAAVELDCDGAERAPQSTLVEMDSPEVGDLRSADIHANQQLIASLSAKNQALLEMNRELETKIHERTHELAAANARLAQLAVTDGLTGLYNPRYFHEQLATEVERSQRSGLALSLLMLDVDHFKQFNDTFGHPAGDEVLRQLACVLSDARRDGDVVARYGGEEFAVIMVDTTKLTAAEIAEQIRERVFAHDFSGAAQCAGRIGVSIGVATFLDDGGDAEALVRAADTALYAAKRAGRNRVVLATETLLAAPR